MEPGQICALCIYPSRASGTDHDSGAKKVSIFPTPSWCAPIAVTLCLPGSRISRLKPNQRYRSPEMLLLIHLSFLLSAGQAIGIPRVFPGNGFGREGNKSVLAQAPTSLKSVPRGLRTPLPFDEDIFDPTHVVSMNPSRDWRCTHLLTTLSTPNERLNFTLVERDHTCPVEIRRCSRPPSRDYTGNFDRPHAENTDPTSRRSEE